MTWLTMSAGPHNEEAMAGPPSMAGGGPGGFGGHSAPGQGGFGGPPRQGENVVLIPCAGVESRIIGKAWYHPDCLPCCLLRVSS
jgi:hypothetical protein